MTDKQIRAAKATLPSRCVIPWKEWTSEQKQLDDELLCRDMINSCLCYGDIKDFWRGCADSFITKLGLDRVKEIVSEQQADFAEATVLYCVHTDSEGVTYNSIVWADDVTERV